MARLSRSLTPLVCATLASVLSGLPLTFAWAQTSLSTPEAPSAMPAPTAADSEVGLWSAVVLGLAALVLIVAMAKFFDLRRRRESEGVQLQAQVSDALLRDRALLGVSVTPTAHVPMWAGSPAVIEVSGDVPSPELRETVLRLVRQEASRVRSEVRIEDRISVLPPRPLARVA